MKGLIVGMMSMIMLVGCARPNASQIREGDPETFIQGVTYDTRQEDAILFSDLEKELQNNNMNLIKVNHPEDGLTGEYHLPDDDRIDMTILVDELTSPDHDFISKIYIEPRNNYMKLSDHPAVKAIAGVMGEERLLTWVAEQEGEMTKANKNDENIQELFAIGRCYLSFEYWVGSDNRRLEFNWALKPHIPKEFEEIAQQLEASGMLITGYVAGVGGETLIATNPDYYILKKINYTRDRKIPLYTDQAASYQVMHDKDKPGSYSVQLYGYMSADLSNPKQVETMPGLDKITQLMGIEHDELLLITDEINKELTEAKRVRNNMYRGEYYLEGAVGQYQYTLTVSQGIEVYNFTVLIEEI